MKKTRVMLFGTFDGLHKGHINLLKQARKLVKNPFIIVSIARDKNVLRIKKKKPILTEKQRLKLVGECNLVDRTILAGLRNHIPHIKKEAPGIIALGYDQRAYVKNLKKELENEGISVKIVRLKPYKEKIYKNHLLNKKI